MQPEARFAKIEAILQAMAERMVQAERRMDRAEHRMEKFDQRLEVTRKLVQVGMKLVIQNNVQLKELQRAQAAFLDSLRKGGPTDTGADAYRPSVNFTARVYPPCLRVMHIEHPPQRRPVILVMRGDETLDRKASGLREAELGVHPRPRGEARKAKS